MAAAAAGATLPSYMAGARLPHVHIYIPQINGSSTTRIWMPSNTPLASADGGTPVQEVRAGGFSKMLTGSTGSHAKPRLVSVVAGDYDNIDDVFSTGDTITLKFDAATYIGRQGSQGSLDPYRPKVEGSTGGVVLSEEGVDALFEFDFYPPDVAQSKVPSLGQGYMGEWTDDSTFVITITNGQRNVPTD